METTPDTKLESPATQPEAQSTAPTNMTPELAQQIGGALQRLHELRAKETPSEDETKEVAGLIEWLADNLITHASELIGCFFVAKFEYSPIVNALGSIFGRHMESYQQKLRAVAASAKKEKSNIVVPPSFKR